MWLDFVLTQSTLVDHVSPSWSRDPSGSDSTSTYSGVPYHTIIDYMHYTQVIWSGINSQAILMVRHTPQ